VQHIQKKANDWKVKMEVIAGTPISILHTIGSERLYLKEINTCIHQGCIK